MAKKILLVDDDRDFVEINRVALESRGYQVSVAYEGETGIQQALKDKPDLIVLDVMMTTKTEGYHVAQQVREQESLRHTPIIMLTAVREEMDLPWQIEPDATWLPVTEFIEKPLPPTKLIQKVDAMLKDKR
ncbi:response regulator [candidate division KSB1 bacterium]|nr:response regulator [candidate division KSB1 bacterium]